MDQDYERLTFDFVTGAGQHAVSSLTGGSRSYTVNWNALHVDTYALIEQYWVGANGVGPWAFINPAMPNLLLPNQAAVTAVFNDARGWGTSTGAADMGALSSNSTATFIHRTGGVRSLRWLWSVSAASFPVLRADPPYRSWFGFPVVVGLPYYWSAWVRADGVVDTSITVAAKIQWYTAAGSLISESSGGDIAVGGWTRLSVTANAPSTAAYGRPVFVATGSSITTGGSLYIDEPLFEQDNALNNWAPGTGARPVEILSLDDSVPFETRMRRSLAMTLRELAA